MSTVFNMRGGEGVFSSRFKQLMGAHRLKNASNFDKYSMNTTISKLKCQLRELRIRRIENKITSTAFSIYPALAKRAQENAGGRRVIATLLDSGNGIRCRYV